MPSPYRGVIPPYELTANVVYFHDWRYVNHGYFSWESAIDQKPFGIWATANPPPMRLRHLDLPVGLELVAMPATISEPIIEPPDDSTILLTGGSLVHDGGVYRVWYECWPGDQFSSPKMGHFNYVRYAESDDGQTWRFPEQNRIEYRGSKKNNIVIGPATTPISGHHGGCVFLDHRGDPKQRYKAIFMGLLEGEAFAKYRRERPNDGYAPHKEHSWALYGATSPDGLNWTQLPDPLVEQLCDTQNCCEFDPVLGQYVIHTRSWYFGRRTIGRTASADFTRLPPAEELIWPNAMNRPCDLWYANGKNVMPGTTDYHVMFALKWSLDEDRFDAMLATSPDNLTWGFVPGGPVMSPGGPESWNAGVIWPGIGMVNLPGDRTGMLMQGSPVPHKHPRKPPLGKLAWATWKKGRLVAARAGRETGFVLAPLKFRGRTMQLNFKCGLAGLLQVEPLGPDGNPLPGRSMSDCDVLTGDKIAHTVTWKSQSDIGHPSDAPVSFRFRMRDADLYSIEFS